MYSDKRPFCSLEVLGVYASLLGMQISYAVNGVLVGNELSKGQNPLAFIVYSNGVGVLVLTPFALLLEKRKRPTAISLQLFSQFFLLSIGGVCAFQALLLMGLKDTSPAFASAMPNLVPAIIFVMAWALGMEKVDITCVGSRSKIAGTLVCVCGAMAMSFLRGPAVSQLWSSMAHSISNPHILHPLENILSSSLHEGNGDSGNHIRGCIYLVSAVTIISIALILQAETVKKYPAPLSLTLITCILGSIETAVLIMVLDRGIKPTSWVLDRSGILIVINAGITINGITLALQLWCLQKRGPVFVTIFSPVATVCSAFLSVLFLGDTLHLGRMEKVDITCVGSRSKIAGTLVCVCGAMAMSFLRGPALSQLLPSMAQSISDPNILHPLENILASSLHEGNGDSGNHIRGCIYLVSAVTILSTTLILQAETVKKYPAPLSLTAITAILGSIETAVLIMVLDRGIKPTSWVIDRSGILTVINGGITINGITLALQLWCMQKRGPVFVTIFTPVSTVCSAILSALFLGDTLHLGSVIGILLIFAGLYLVLWGKSQDTITHKISSEIEEDLHIAEEEHHHPSSQVLDVKTPLLR